MEEVKQPEIDVQKLLSDLTRNESETIEVNGHVTTIGWLHKDTEARIAHLMLKEKNAEKRLVKWFSLVKLDRRSGFLTWVLSWLGYWIYWRWLWYVKRERCTAFQMEVILTSKKKIKERSDALGLITVLMIEAMDTMMTTARHERGQVARRGEEITP